MQVRAVQWSTPPIHPKPPRPFFGQERALRALEDALRLKAHAYLVGPSGLGKRHHLEALLKTRPVEALDLVYLPLGNEGAPVLLPPGAGRGLLEGVEALLGEFSPALFRERAFLYAKTLAEARHRREAERLLQALAEEAQRHGYILEENEEGLKLSGQGPLPTELSLRLEETVLAYLEAAQKAQAEVAALRRGYAERLLAPRVERLKKAFPQAGRYLDWLFERLLLAAALEEEVVLEEVLPRLLVEEKERLVYEPIPTPERLFGHLEYEQKDGGVSTHLGLLQAGALHRATGGFLVLEAAKVLEYGSYPLLKQALRQKEVEPIRRLEAKGPKIRPAPLTAQVFLVGPPEVFALLEEDEEFLELFKIRVEFSPDLPYTEENAAQLGGFLEAQGVRLTPYGLAALVDEARRRAEHLDRMDARLFYLLDLAKEAQAHQDPVGREGVEKALRAREERFALEEETYRREVEEGVLTLSTRGLAVGEINGLVVLEGPIPQGRVVRITARAAPGREGVLSIDREVGLGGQLFHKAVLTLAGYLRGTYSEVGALSATVSLVFEQNYGGLEGDSAGLAELLAVLSAISGLPLRQDLAVTGAIDQTGRVLAVGRVAEKVEGFYQLCQLQGLTNTQGVVLPEANLRHLTLRREVVEAVERGQFHLYAVKNVDQAIELLFGMRPQGFMGFHARVKEALAHFQALENGGED
ncbi:MAG: ATP-dependent protease [Thermus sp.]|uniref:AAA family ATPase n=1 Tax=Thermus sp. TaxID=275 RepID=UPI0033202C0E